MNILNNKKIKNIIISIILLIIISSIALTTINIIQNNKYKKEVNYKICLILENIKEQYPNADDEEIIKILNEKKNSNIKENILRKYGIYEEDLTIQSLKKQEKSIYVSNICILIITSLILIFIFYKYLKYRKREIDKITDYIEKVSSKDYTLNIEENSEDELSSLKNELYKITVMLKEQAENSINQKEALAMSVSDISHQLKTPLTSILILLDNVSQNDNMDTATRKKFIREISRQIESMNWLVISLLKLSRLDAGVTNFSNTSINANELIKDVISNLEIMAELKNVNFKIKYKKECFFYGDYNWNKEALQNIVKNAIEHTKENTKITIDIEENDVYTSISIKDAGEGISKKDIKHIFDRFYKSDNSSENSFGIGLSLSKSIIEKQNGYIQVNTKENEGTEFKIKYIK